MMFRDVSPAKCREIGTKKAPNLGRPCAGSSGASAPAPGAGEVLEAPPRWERWRYQRMADNWGYHGVPLLQETPKYGNTMGKMGKVLNAVPFSDAAWRLKIAKDQAASGRSSFRIACRRLSRVTSSPPDFRRSFSVSSNVDLAKPLCASRRT